MTDYPVGQWIGWNGGECPVHPETVVEAIKPKLDVFIKAAKCFDWSRPTLFRIVTPYVAPAPKLECWVNVYDGKIETYVTKTEADYWGKSGRVRCVRMVEADE